MEAHSYNVVVGLLTSLLPMRGFILPEKRLDSLGCERIRKTRFVSTPAIKTLVSNVADEAALTPFTLACLK